MRSDFDIYLQKNRFLYWGLDKDGNVKKINTYITKKVADKLNELFKDNRKEFENKWKDINLFVKYGMISEEKFAWMQEFQVISKL